MLKKVAVITATLFVGSICAGYVVYDIIAEKVMAQTEENQNEGD